MRAASWNGDVPNLEWKNFQIPFPSYNNHIPPLLDLAPPDTNLVGSCSFFGFFQRRWWRPTNKPKIVRFFFCVVGGESSQVL
jgi:hypothetical protein